MSWFDDLLRDLSSDDDRVQQDAIGRASDLFEQTRRVRAHDEARATPRHTTGRRRTQPSLSNDEFVAQLRETYGLLLPPDTIGLRLQDHEADAMAAALVQLVDREVPTTSEIFALGKGLRQEAIPQIAAALRRCTVVDRWVVHQASYTLRDLVWRPGPGRLSRALQESFHQACRAIGSAITPTLNYPPWPADGGWMPDPRVAAVQALESICGRFAPRRSPRLLPRVRTDERSNSPGAVVQTTRLPTGDVAVFGPVRTGMHDSLQAPVEIERPDGSRISASHVGRYFELGAWPPRMAQVFRRVDADDLPTGSRFVVDHTQEEARFWAESTRSGSPSGNLTTLDLEDTIVRAGLPDDAFIRIYRRIEDLNPLGEIDPERVAWMAEITDEDARTTRNSNKPRKA